MAATKALLFVFMLLTVEAYAAVANVPWVINGGAARQSPMGRIMVTSDAGAQAGSMWNPCTINMNTSFNMCFIMNFGVKVCGADGMTFTLQNAGTNALGADSGEHGYSGIGNSLAVAFDTYQNPAAPYYDPANHSINLNRNGGTAFEGPGNATCPGTFGTGWATGDCRTSVSASQPTISDGQDHTMCVDWNAGSRTLSISFDGVFRTAWILPASYLTDTFGGNPNVYYGFTGSTGGATNFQQVEQISGYAGCAVAPIPTPAQTPTPINLPTISCGTPIPTYTPAGTPTITPTFTVTPTPFPAGCGTPLFVGAQMAFNGCLNNGANTYAHTITVQPNQILIVRVEHNAADTPTSITYGGIPLNLQSAGALPGGMGAGYLRTYYLTNPATGPQNLVVNSTGSCSWNIAMEVWRNVDMVTPLGTYNGTQGGQNTGFSVSMTSVGPFSVMSNYITADQANNGGVDAPAELSGQTSFNLVGSGAGMGCCNGVFGDYKTIPAPGLQTYNYSLPQNRFWASQPIEIRGSTCMTPTNTPLPSPTFTRTSTSTFTRSDTPSSTLTHTPTLTSTPTLSFTLTDTRTATITVSATPTNTLTSTPSLTATRTATPTLTPTQSVTLTATLTSTPTLTVTLTPTRTVTPTQSVTLTATLTSSPTATASVTPTRSVTTTQSSTLTSTLTPTPTFTQTLTPTRSVTVTQSSTSTLSATATATPSVTYTTTATLTRTPTATPTSSPTSSVTLSATPSSTLSITSTPTPSATPSNTATATRTASPTVTATFTVSSTRSVTPTITITSLDTATVSPTVSPTPTASPSSTATPTRTATYTLTATRSATPTITNTFTPTSTQSPGPSATDTVTATATPTFTPSVTVTPSSTASPTASFSATSSLTATPSSSRTATPSATPTSTGTPTQSPGPSATNSVTSTWSPTLSPTPSATPTKTPTSTPTSTFSDSPTQSPGPSATDSMTSTWTPTLSPTPTATLTKTPTSTPTSTFSNSPTQSPGPSATDTPTASPSSTGTSSSTPTGTYTATPSASPANTSTFTSSVTPSASRTASPSVTLTRTASPSTTPSSTRSATLTSTRTVTATPSITVTPTTTVTFSSTPTPVPMPYRLTVSVYNSAGEVVRKVYDGPAETTAGTYSLDHLVLGSSDPGIYIGFPGLLAGGVHGVLWAGDNNNGQAVAGGTYSFKVDQVDPFGVTTSWTTAVTVLPRAPQQTLVIYNSGGEVVARLSLPASGSSRFSEFSTASTLVVGGASGGAKFLLKNAAGVDLPLHWDGRNGLGGLVLSGSYTAQLITQSDGGPLVVMSKAFVILRGSDDSATVAVFAAPNPVMGNTVTLVYGTLQPGQTAVARIYNAGGELIAQAGDASNSGKLALDVARCASGLYLAVFEVHEGMAVASRRVVKLAVKH